YVGLTFALVIVGYAVAGHTIDSLLYPDPAFREALYRAAALPAVVFDILIVVLVAVIAAGWVLVFWSAASQQPFSRRYRNMYISLSALMSREFHVADLYGRFAQSVLALSRRLNGLLRWV
ncbi:MAG: hypothetical protein WBP72_14625, partial [Rhodocyclaceae bacterium]